MTKFDEFHKKNDYCTKVQRLPNHAGVVVKYSKNIIRNNNVDEASKIYEIKEEGILVNFDYPEIYNKLYNMERYLYRPFIAMDIVLTSLTRNITYDLFYFYDEQLNISNTKSVINFLKVNLEPEDKIKERNICDMFGDILYGIDCLAKSKQQKIENGYRLLSNLMLEGESK